jgi:hypothetical protein
MYAHPLMHPALAAQLHQQRQAELEREAMNQRAAREFARPNRVERYFIKRREGNVTRIETVMVHRSA